MPEQVWRTEDGRIFESLVEAEEHESILQLYNLIKDCKKDSDIDDFALARRLMDSKKVLIGNDTNEKQFEGI